MTAIRTFAALAILLLAIPAASAATSPLQQAGVDEQLGQQVPLDIGFRDQRGRRVRFGDLLDGRPALLMLGYYHCPMLCSLVFTAAAKLRGELDPAPRLISASIDPRDDPESAAERRQAVVGDDAADTDWPFLVGDAAASKRLAEAVGFRYRYDESIGQYAHPAVAVVLTPGGVVSSYLYGTRFPAARAATALRAAAAGKTAPTSPVDRILLRCYQYVPSLRRYGKAVNAGLRAGGVLTLLAFGFLIARTTRRRAARRA